MRLSLLYNPRLICERLSGILQDRRRLRTLRHTVAAGLELGHLDSLELLELLRDNPPKVIYDIGAFSGTWTLLAKAIFPNSEVHAFEPLASLASDFSERTGHVAGVYRHPVAIGSTRGRLPLQLANALDCSSLLKIGAEQTRQFHVTSAGTEMVDVERLDEYVGRNGLPLPNLIKLDVQGFELEALRGADECLKAAYAVISEVSFIELYQGQCLFGDIVEFLKDRKFLTRAFSVATSLGRPLIQTDVLFQKPDDETLRSNGLG